MRETSVQAAQASLAQFSRGVCELHSPHTFRLSGASTLHIMHCGADVGGVEKGMCVCVT